MANSTSIQILNDGPRNTTVKLEGVLDTSDVAYTAFLDPSAQSPMFASGTKASTYRIKKIIHNIEDTLSVNLFWDATTPRRIEELVGRGAPDYNHIGGLVNNATLDAGYTGKLGYSTQGWAASGVLSFSVIIELVKCQ